MDLRKPKGVRVTIFIELVSSVLGIDRKKPHTGESKDLVADVNGGVVLAAIQRVLSPGAQVLFHRRRSDAPDREEKTLGSGHQHQQAALREFASQALRRCSQ